MIGLTRKRLERRTPKQLGMTLSVAAAMVGQLREKRAAMMLCEP